MDDTTRSVHGSGDEDRKVSRDRELQIHEGLYEAPVEVKHAFSQVKKTKGGQNARNPKHRGHPRTVLMSQAGIGSSRTIESDGKNGSVVQKRKKNDHDRR